MSVKVFVEFIKYYLHIVGHVFVDKLRKLTHLIYHHSDNTMSSLAQYSIKCIFLLSISINSILDIHTIFTLKSIICRLEITLKTVHYFR